MRIHKIEASFCQTNPYIGVGKVVMTDTLLPTIGYKMAGDSAVATPMKL